MITLTRLPDISVAYAALFQEDFTPLRLSSDTDLPVDVTVADLNFHYGDRGDWYILPTPQAIKQFGGADAAQLVRQMLALHLQDPELQVATSPVRQRLASYGYDYATGTPGRMLFLFAGQDTDAGAGVTVVPVEQFAGVPDYYLLHVININDLAVLGSARVTNPEFKHGTSS